MRVILMASGDLWAGAEVMVYQLASGLVTIPEVEFLVVLLNEKRLAKELERLGVNVQVFDEAQSSFFSIARAIRVLVAEFSPNIIHSHRYKENVLAWFSARGRKEIKLVATQHGMPEAVGNSPNLTGRLRTRLFFRLLSCCFDRTVLVSKDMRRLLVGSYGFSKKNTTVIHNGIPLPGLLSYRSEQHIFVGTAGRLFPVKDFSLFIEIANSVVAEHDQVDFVIAGDGPQYEMLKEKVALYGLQKHFQLLGHQSDMEVFYRSLDVYVNTSVHEGIPMSVLEAMSYGLPVVVPDLGGFPEIVQNGEQGFLVTRRKKKDYIDRILELVRRRSLRLKMAKSSRDRVVNCFSRGVMAQEYSELYRMLTVGK